MRILLVPAGFGEDGQRRVGEDGRRVGGAGRRRPPVPVLLYFEVKTNTDRFLSPPLFAGTNLKSADSPDIDREAMAARLI